MEKKFAQLVVAALEKKELMPADIPKIDLYMDQILTLFDEAAAADTYKTDERIVTKTMINNYSKGQLIMPVKGKKYTREQIMQLLCVLELKQTLPLSDVKRLMEHNPPQSFEHAINRALALKARLREKLPAMLDEVFGELFEEENFPQRDLALALTLASGAGDLRRICEGLIQPPVLQEKKKQTQ